MTEIQTLKTVALADTRWAGHHPTYLLELTASLLRCGARVILLCTDPSEIKHRLEKLKFSELEAKLICIPFTARNHSYFHRDRDHDPATTILRWYLTGSALRRAESSYNLRTDFVFLPYLDSYMRFAPMPILPRLFLNRPWSGLYFRNHHFAEQPGLLKMAAKGDILLRNSQCQAICVLDERFNNSIERISNRPVINFPDMTDETFSGETSAVGNVIVERANGRKIIGLISMEKRKGLLTLLRTAERAHRLGEPWYFVATGPFLRATFSAEELAYCESLQAKAASGELDNLFLDTSGERIPDGVEYNSLFNRFDLIWAAYEGFEGSSNALTKAAAFKKPLIATAGQCIGNRVEAYQMGTTFAEGNVDTCLRAIRSVLKGTDLTGKTLVPDFSGYHGQHSRERLDAIFRDFISPKQP